MEECLVSRLVVAKLRSGKGIRQHHEEHAVRGVLGIKNGSNRAKRICLSHVCINPRTRHIRIELPIDRHVAIQVVPKQAKLPRWERPTTCKTFSRWPSTQISRDDTVNILATK